MALDSSTIESAGLGSGIGGFNQRMAGLEGKITDLNTRRTEKQTELEKSQAEQVRLTKEAGEAAQPVRDAISAKIADAPSHEVNEIPPEKYERPTMRPEQLQEAFGAMMAASLLTGAISRNPYNNSMTAMTGMMDGFSKRDDAMVKQSMETFDKNFKVVTERNAELRRAVDDTWKKYQNDLVGLKTNLEIVLSKYDQPIALEVLRTKGLSAAVDHIDKLTTTYENMETNVLKMREQFQQHEDARQDRLSREAIARADRQAKAAQAGAAGAGGVSEQYKTDPEYKARVDFWAKYYAQGNPLPPRFQQTAGKQMATDVFTVVPTIGGGNPADVTANKLSLREMTAEAQKLGTQAASVAIANKELMKFIPQAEKAIDGVPRSGWRPLNELIQKGENTWSSEQGKLVIANQAVINAYSQLIQRGAPTVHSLTEAKEMLNSADSPAVYKAKLAQLVQEGKAAEEGLVEAKDDLLKRARSVGSGKGDDEASEARSAIAAGADASKVKARYKERTGKDLPDG